MYPERVGRVQKRLKRSNKTDVFIS